MKKFTLFLNALFTISTIHAGVSIDTIVDTSNGPKQMSSLQVGDEVTCFDHNLTPTIKPIKTIEEVEVESVIQIVTEDDVVIHVSPDQRLFISYKWVQADQLSLGDLLLKQDRTLIRIKGICHIQEPVKLRFITVEEYQNFLITNNGILIHNGAAGATGGFWIGRFIGQAIGYGSALIISLPALAGGPVVYGIAVAATAGTIAPVVESASQVTGLAGGIIGGTITGPV